MVKDLLLQKGFDFLDSIDACATIAQIGEELGGVYTVPTMPFVQSLTPRSAEFEQPNTYSGLFGLGEFPFHSDMAHWNIPPRYIVMRCAIGFNLASKWGSIVNQLNQLLQTGSNCLLL
jgi:L-asparagine oxygenase